MMGFLRWIYRRVGQMGCFTLGGLFLYGSVTAYGESLVQSLAAAILMTVALALRHQMIARFYLTRPDLDPEIRA
jgi:hypothetical protein